MNKDEIIKRILSSIILIPTVLFFIIKGSFLFNFFIFICFLITTYEWLKLSKNNLLKFFGTIFIVISFYAIFKIRNEFETPEHINNSIATAPSKRIKRLFNQYDKVIHGSLITLEVGIDKICKECNLFDAWVNQLKSIEALS